MASKIDEKFTGHNHAHGPLIFRPNEQKGLDRIQAMIQQIDALLASGNDGLSAIGVIVALDRKLQSRLDGVAFCPGCVQQAIHSYRDLVGVLEDMLKLPAKAQ